jgi:dynein heavy chain 1
MANSFLRRDKLARHGTQRVISFLRQLVEHGGFYRTSDHSLVRLERIQFVGACNPPTDPGRKPLSHRFLRHVPVVYVDYPGETSLKQVKKILFIFRKKKLNNFLIF